MKINIGDIVTARIHGQDVRAEITRIEVVQPGCKYGQERPSGVATRSCIFDLNDGARWCYGDQIISVETQHNG